MKPPCRAPRQAMRPRFSRRIRLLAPPAPPFAKDSAGKAAPSNRQPTAIALESATPVAPSGSWESSSPLGPPRWGRWARRSRGDRGQEGPPAGQDCERSRFLCTALPAEQRWPLEIRLLVVASTAGEDGFAGVLSPSSSANTRNLRVCGGVLTQVLGLTDPLVLRPM
mgnify:CR=1 FL=1